MTGRARQYKHWGPARATTPDPIGTTGMGACPSTWSYLRGFHVIQWPTGAGGVPPG